jgi:hypothetical protein
MKVNTVGGSPTASHFLLLRQKESNQRKGDPGFPPTSWVPCVARLLRRLRNSRYALRQSSPKSPDQPALLGGAQGKTSQKLEPPCGHFVPTQYGFTKDAIMSWKNIDNINFKDPYERLPLNEIHPLSERAVSHIARSRNLPILKESFVNIYGAVEMMQGLTYHHGRFMNLVEGCHTVVPTIQTAGAIRHEVVAYLNRLGQFWTFSRSALVKEYCATPEEILPTFSKLIVFRNKYVAHRSIDMPKAEDTDGLQVMNAISLSILGGQLFHPKPNLTAPDLSSVLLKKDSDWDELRYSLYKNSYLGFQIYDVKNSDYVNFFIEQDHELIIREAYCLICTLLPYTAD